FAVSCPLALVSTAFYPVLVHRPAASLRASSPHSVALMQLRFASLIVINSRWDFHPQECAHAGRTRKKPRTTPGLLSNWAFSIHLFGKSWLDEIAEAGACRRLIATALRTTKLPTTAWGASPRRKTELCLGLGLDAVPAERSRKARSASRLTLC